MAAIGAVLLICGGIEQVVQFSGIGKLDLHKPTLAERLAVNLCID